MIFLALFVIAAQGADKIVLGEIFTNTGCGPCVPANDHFDEIYGDVDDVFVMIRYHPWWPSSSDPFYLYNTEDNSDRTRFYDVSGVPALAVDGDVLSWTDVTETLIRSRASMGSGIDLNVYAIGTDSVRVEFTVEDDGPHGNAKVFAVVTEDTIHYTAPNGQTVFHQVMRDMLSGSSGRSVHLDPGEDYSYNFALEIDEDEWDMERCHIVAFVQESGSMGDVYNAAIAPLFAPLDYDYTTGPTGNLADMVMEDETAEMGFKVTNRGLNTDEYSIWFVEDDIPEPWDVTIQSELIGDFDSAAINIPSFENIEFSLSVRPNGHRDNKNIPVIVHSEHLGISDTILFAIVTPNDYLIVNASNDPAIGEMYKTMADDIGLRYAYWNQAYNGILGDFEEMPFVAVFWITGENNINPLDALPRSTLHSYVNDYDGKLFISGNHIGEHAGADFNLFYRTFGAMNSDPYEPGSRIHFVEDNPVHHGSYFDIEADEVESMEPFASAEPILVYTDELFGGVINDLGDEEEEAGRVVYLSFGLEDVTGGVDLPTFFEAAYNWLMTGDAVEENRLKNIPANIEFLSAYPSPFNGACNFRIHPPAGSQNIKVEIHDINGRPVDMVFDGQNTESSFELRWLPKDKTASGVYLVVLSDKTAIIETAKTIYMK
ncbi:MAG: Omp28-related outer membrane protein [Candidatus Zixiibacteriota bacterium]